MSIPATNDGLTIAELELPSEDAQFEKPSWLGAEVTGDRRYYAARLSIEPYSNWSGRQSGVG